MSGLSIKPHLPYKTKVFPSVLLSPKDARSFVFDDQIGPAQKLAYFQSPRRNLKLGHLVPENKKDSMNRNQSLPQISNMLLKGGSKNVFNDDQLTSVNTRRNREKHVARDTSPNTSEMELKDTSFVTPSIVTFETASKFGSRKTISPNRSPDVTRDNLLKVMNYTKVLKILAKEAGKEPTRKKAKLCQNILSSLSKEEGKYQDEMTLLKTEIRSSVFCNSQDVLDRIDMISEDILKNMTRISLPYFEVVDRLLDFIEKSQNKTMEKQQEDQQKILKLRNQIETQSGYQTNRLLEDQKLDIEQLTREFNTSLENLNAEKGKMYLELQSYIEDVEAVVGSTQVDDYVEQIKLLSNKRIETEKQLKEASAEAERVKLCYRYILDNYKTSLVKWNVLKDQVDKLEDNVGKLRTENAKLVATVTGFANLTPRPNLTPVLAFLGIESKKHETTAENIEFINKVIKDNESKQEE